MALQRFEPGEVVADVEGILYTEEELQDDRYCLWVEDGYYFDMVDQTRWINHSHDPNVEVEAELDGKGGAWARIVASRAIEPGEELTYDYAFPAALAEPCSCGAPSCSGYIVDADELPELVLRLDRDKRRKRARSPGIVEDV
jgi:hypothetical protein